MRLVWQWQWSVVIHLSNFIKNYKIAIVIIYNFFLLAKKNKAKKYTNYKFFNLPKYYLELLNASILLQCHLATNSLFISKYYICRLRNYNRIGSLLINLTQNWIKMYKIQLCFIKSIFKLTSRCFNPMKNH